MIEDQQLVARILAGQQDAYGLLIKRYEKLVFHMVGRLIQTPDDRNDICQEVFIRVYRQLGQFKFESTLATWIARIAYRLSINYLRQKKRIQPPDDFDQYQVQWLEQDNPEQALIKQDITAYLHQLIDKLPPAYRTILTLYHWQEFSYEEIGQITGLPDGTVKNYLFRARRLLKESLVVYLKNEIS